MSKREINLDEDRLAMEAPSKGKDKERVKHNSERGGCIRWITEGHYSLGEACAFKHDPNKKAKGKGRPRSLSPTGSPHQNSRGNGKGSDDGSAKETLK